MIGMFTLALPTYQLDGWGGNMIDDGGVEWIVTGEDGWSAAAPTRVTVEDRPDRDGGWDAPGFDSSRVVTLEGTTIAPTQVDQNRAKDRLNAVAAATRGLYPLVVGETHVVRMAMVRRSGRPKIADRGALAFDWSITLVAPDPRKYDAREVTVTAGAGDVTTSTGPDGSVTTAANARGGRRYPRRYPVTYRQESGGGNPAPVAAAVMVENVGTRDTGGVIDIRGPIRNPSVTNLRTGRILAFALELGVDDVLSLDLLERTAVLNGTLPRGSSLLAGSAWWLHDPGQTWLRLGGELPASGSPRMAVRYRSAWR